MKTITAILCICAIAAQVSKNTIIGGKEEVVS